MPAHKKKRTGINRSSIFAFCLFSSSEVEVFDEGGV